MNVSKIFLSPIVQCITRVSSCNRMETRKANFHFTKIKFQPKSTDASVYTIRLALPPDYENVVDFMCEAYYKHEPAIVNIGLNNSKAPSCWWQMMYEQVEEGLSLIAVDAEHCIVAAALNNTVMPSESQKLYEFAKCCEPVPIRRVIEFFAYVLEKSNVCERFCVPRMFQQGSIAVSKEFQGLGIARKLIEASWHLARDCCYPLFCIECNNRYCARICEGFGWQLVWSIPFSQYVRNGEVVFKHIKPPHTICQVYIDPLTYNKTYYLPYKRSKKVEPPLQEK